MTTETTYAVGTRIYYTGDVCNQSGFGTIARHRPASDRFPGLLFDITFDDGRESNCLTPANFSVGPGRRFWLESDYLADRARKIEEMQAEFAAMSERLAAR